MDSQSVRLKKLTETLKNGNREAYDQFMNHTLAGDYDTDFQRDVKPFADRYQAIINQWQPLVEGWVENRKPKYVFPVLIKDTCENLSIVIVTAFQKDTRKRRFIETIKAIDYVLDNVLDQLDADILEEGLSH